MSHPTARRTRRAIALAGLAVLTVALPVDPGSAEEPFAPGRGQAIGRAYKINPKAAGLSLGISLGLSLAGHQNTAATAESRAVDLGIIGTLLAAEGCAGGAPTLPAERQPRPLSVSSRDEGAAGGKTASEQGLATKHAAATDDPFAEAVTTILPLGVPGLVEISGGRSVTTSGVLDGAREAVAVVEVAEVDLAGVVELGGLRWVARHRTGADEVQEGTFSIGSASIGGSQIPTEGRDPAEVLEQVNAALQPLGIVIVPPVSRSSSGIQFVEPLSIGIVPSPERDALVNTITGPLQPVREQLFDAILQADCRTATPITVADVVVGALTGAGSLSLELGGVQASTSDIALSSRLGGLGGRGSLSPVPPTGGTSSLGSRAGAGALPLVDTPAGSDPAVASTGGGGGTPLAGTQAASAGDGGRGGAMAAVALAGLVLVALSAEADRRRMRRALRTIPLEAST